MKLQLIRHGEPDYSIDSLTEKGWREADILADRLCREPADAYYVSPLGRARDTARATLTRLGREAEVLPWLQEFRSLVRHPESGEKAIAWDFMPQDWTHWPEFFRADGWLDQPLLRDSDAREVYRETVQGLDALLARHGYMRDGMLYRTERNRAQTLVLFCHFGISMFMLSHLLGVSPMLLLHGLIVAPSSVTTLVTEERVPGQVWFRCVELGDTSHLYAAGEPVSYSGRFHECYGQDEGRGSM